MLIWRSNTTADIIYMITLILRINSAGFILISAFLDILIAENLANNIERFSTETPTCRLSDHSKLNKIVKRIHKRSLDVSGQQDKRSINTSLSRLPNCPKSCLCMEVSQSDPVFFEDLYASYTPSYANIHSGKLDFNSLSYEVRNQSIPTTTRYETGTKKPLTSSSTQVICSNTDLKILPRNLPASTVKLDLSKNEISFIPSRAFENLPIRTLILDDNEIREIKPYAFAGMPELQSLLMKNNPLDVLGQNSLSGINGTRTINLGSNHIDRIEREAFEDTQNVEFIDLSENPLTYIKTKAFRGLKNVRFLVFSTSGLKNLEPGCFDGLENVNHISMTRVPLTNLEPNTFRGLKNVEELEIRHAKISRIKDYAFRDSFNIQRVTLSQINLEQLDKRAFSSMILKSVEYYPTLESQGFNKSRRVPYTGMIKNVRLIKLEKLDISQNKLTYMHPLLFVDFAKTFIDIDVSHNPIACGCNMSWVQAAKYFYQSSSMENIPHTTIETFRSMGMTEEQAMRLSNATFRFNRKHISQLKCHSPLHLRGKALINVDFGKEFGCDRSDPLALAEQLQKIMASKGKSLFRLINFSSSVTVIEMIVLTFVYNIQFKS